MDTILQDIRYALRTLRKQRAFAITAIATLALATGASTAIFSVVEASLFRPFPFRTPERLAFAWGVAGPTRDIRGASVIEAQDWARLNRAFESLAIYDEDGLTLGGSSEGATRIEAEMVSASFFPMLGATAQLGRVFGRAEDSIPNTFAVVTISDALWRSRFGADPGIVGRTLTFNDRPFTVLGVMQPGFKGLSFDTDVWFPAMMTQANGGPTNIADRGNRWLATVGRLKDGVTLEQAQADADRVAAQLTKDFPDNNRDRGIQLMPLRDNYLGSTRQLIWSVFAGVGLLLLIAGANVLGLQIVRSASRSREMALRQAIGADRARLTQQLVVEGLVLSIVGTALGLLVANWGLPGLTALAPLGALPRYVQPEINAWAFAFAAVVATACGVVFGLVPALRSSRVHLSEALKKGTRGSSAGFGGRIGGHRLLVVAETAVAVVLLVGAGLFVRSLQRQLAVATGFEARGVLRARLQLPPAYSAERTVQTVEEIRAAVSALPSVDVVGVGSDLPLTGNANATRIFVPETQQSLRMFRHWVLPEYFTALGIKIEEGRAFDATDRVGPPVIAVSRAAARRYWPGESPVGKRIRLGNATAPEATIVAVIGDVRQRDLTTPLATSDPDFYLPWVLRPSTTLDIAVHTKGSPLDVAGALQRTIAGVDPAISVAGVRTFEDLLRFQTATSRFASTLLTVFGGAALVLTAVGLYGVLAFLVGMRRREIGIRLALGAPTGRVLREVMQHGMLLIGAGALIGGAVAAGATRLIETQLFNVGRYDPVAFLVAPLVLLAVAVLASWLPARRAAAVDPQMTLRSEG